MLLAASLRLNEQHLRMLAQTESLDRLARTDLLLRIANRRELQAALEREVNQSARLRQPLAVIMPVGRR